MTTRILTTISAALLLAATAFSQTSALAKAEAMRAHMHVRQFKAGSALPQDANPTTPFGPPQAQSAKLYVWADRPYYLPGENLQVRAMGIASDAQNLQFFVNETFVDLQGNAFVQPQRPCDCGGANGGYVPDLRGFNFITLVEKKVPWAIGGRYDFYITAYQFITGTPNQLFYQSAMVRVNIGVSYNPVDAPIRIDSLTTGMGQGPVIFLTGKFPVNVPLYFMVGALPYQMSFTDQPVAVSTDGNTLILPGLYDGIGMEGRIVLMTEDGTFSVTSAQTIVTHALQNNSQAAGGPAQ